jgi:hypothetical protein
MKIKVQTVVGRVVTQTMLHRQFPITADTFTDYCSQGQTIPYASGKILADLA